MIFQDVALLVNEAENGSATPFSFSLCAETDS